MKEAKEEKQPQAAGTDDSWAIERKEFAYGLDFGLSDIRHNTPLYFEIEEFKQLWKDKIL